MRNSRGAAALLVSGMLVFAACNRTGSKQQAGQDGAVGTSGRAGTITISTDGEPPVFVSRDREGERLWALTKQFYQKRGGGPAWIDGTTARPQMDELIQ